jgi:hypothetical protein
MSRATHIERGTLTLVPPRGATSPRRVELRGPADHAFVRLARTVTVSVASQCGFPVDPCDELRIAVDESCNILIHGGAEDLSIDFVDDGSGLVVDVSSPLDEVPQLVPTAQLVLTTMVDELHVDRPGRIVLHKRLV